jgi:hypothetical protein
MDSKDVISHIRQAIDEIHSMLSDMGQYEDHRPLQALRTIERVLYMKEDIRKGLIRAEKMPPKQAKKLRNKWANYHHGPRNSLSHMPAPH